ncbi:hypothetical protein H311_01919 [Anncaliia algerae PRA109]|nr:hypothetical protein H311_01919 [Anncaliia algerae PRA109]
MKTHFCFILDENKFGKRKYHQNTELRDNYLENLKLSREKLFVVIVPQNASFIYNMNIDGYAIFDSIVVKNSEMLLLFQRKSLYITGFLVKHSIFINIDRSHKILLRS